MPPPRLTTVLQPDYHTYYCRDVCFCYCRPCRYRLLLVTPTGESTPTYYNALPTNNLPPQKNFEMYGSYTHKTVGRCSTGDPHHSCYFSTGWHLAAVAVIFPCRGQFLQMTRSCQNSSIILFKTLNFPSVATRYICMKPKQVYHRKVRKNH